MDTEVLSRIFFALTAAFHYIFPPISIGLSLYIFIVEALWVFTKDEKYLLAAKFFLKLFGLIFAIGVATGILMVFQFGTNWPVYSNFVGDIFGSPLAIEAIAAFFLESTFLAIALFGWKRVGAKTHLFATSMVALGTHLSAIWILAANSFMHTPAGFGIYKGAERMAEGFVPPSSDIASYSARIEDFFAMVFSPSFLDRLSHTTSAAWITGGFFALGVCAYFILRKRNLDVFEKSAKIALTFSLFACFAMLFTGHKSGQGVIKNQPEKIAAFEANYETQEHAPMYLFAWVNEDKKEVKGLRIKNILSILAYGRADAKIVGLNDLPSDEFLLKLHPNSSKEELAKIRPEYWPPVNLVFQTFHLMAYLGGAMFVLVGAGLLFWQRKILFNTEKLLPRILWKCFLPSVLLPLIASQVGWACAEVGRQPWIVWHILKTKDAVTTVAAPSEILFSIILFLLLYCAITVVFCIVFLDKLRKGIDANDVRETY